MENKLLQGMLDWHERMLKEKRFNIPLDHEQSEYLLWLASDIKNNPSQYIDCVRDEEIEAMADEAGYPRSDKSTFETTYWTQHNIWVEGYKASHTAPDCCVCGNIQHGLSNEEIVAEKVGVLIKRFGEVVVERTKWKEKYEQECTNHEYTRLSWDRTIEGRDKLKAAQTKPDCCVWVDVKEDKIKEKADKYAEEHGFRVPYDGSNKFYDNTDVKASREGFIAGANEVIRNAQEYIVCCVSDEEKADVVASVITEYEQGLEILKEKEINGHKEFQVEHTKMLTKVYNSCYKASHTAPVWVDVKERLPETLDDVWTCNSEYECAGMCYYDSELKKWIDPDIRMKHEVIVTHWMPLPEPPSNNK